MYIARALIIVYLCTEPRYSDDDKKCIHRDKDPQPAPQCLRESVEMFLADVIVLLHTVKEEELLAVYVHMTPPMPQLNTSIHWSPDGKISLTLGMFGNHKAAVVQTRKGRDCQHEIQYALKALPHVQLIIAVGFAYGRREKCALGDVIVSTNVDGVSNLRFVKDEIRFDEGIARYTNMSTRTENAFARRGWMALNFNCIKDGERNAEIHTGVIISSPTLVNDRKALDCYLKNNERFIGGEMEGQELAQCTQSFAENNRFIDFIVIKGVADFGDGSNEKSWQLTASLAAATYAEQKLRDTQGQMYRLPGRFLTV